MIKQTINEKLMNPEEYRIALQKSILAIELSLKPKKYVLSVLGLTHVCEC